MPSATSPSLSADDVDDLTWYSRTGDLPALKTLFAELVLKHSSTASAILAAAIDVDGDGLGSQCCLLHWPAANGELDVLEYLLSLLPSPQQNGITSTRPACLLVNHKNNNGNTPLHWAALNCHLACVRRLVEVGADPSIANAAGHDALFEAERSGKDDGKGVADWLLVHCEGLEKATSGQVVQGEGDVMAEVGEAVGEMGLEEKEGT